MRVLEQHITKSDTNKEQIPLYHAYLLLSITLLSKESCKLKREIFQTFSVHFFTILIAVCTHLLYSNHHKITPWNSAP